MPGRIFSELLQRQWEQGKFVCIGLDSALNQIPTVGALTDHEDESRRLAFNKAIVDATKDVACAYKPNSAFYEGTLAGITTLQETIRYINDTASHIPVILDAKRGDVGNTNDGYITAAFNELHADAITVHPYLGKESLEPFLAQSTKGIIVLVRTSNPGAGEIQDLDIHGQPLYLKIAEQIATHWNTNGNCGVVVGATYPEELGKVRSVVGDMPILIPGIGAQGGDLKATVLNGRNSKGTGMLINSSRGIIFASKGPDFAEAAHKAAVDLHTQINEILESAQ